MEKLYDRIEWHNNTTPAINETNLNLMSKAIDDIDDRVIDIAADVLVTVPQIQEDLEEAQELLEDAQEISTHPPIIGQNGNWWTWDTSIDAYADSGVDAGVSLTIGNTATLPAGNDATVTNTGTATDPILNFGIPRGPKGDDGVSPEVTVTSITGGHQVNITDADHPSGQSFNVMDGEDGAVTGVKGNSESTYRTGNVNITPANVGAVPTSNIKNTYQSSPTANTEVYDAEYINNLAGCEAVQITTSGWSSGTTSVAGKSCYYKTLTLTNAVYGIPEVKLKPANGVPTESEENLFNCLDYYGVDSASPNTLKVYAVTKPTSSFYIWVIRNGGRV